MMPREILTVILLALLIICAIAVNVIPNLLQSVVIFMAYSSIMSVVWILMESPDLGITEAAVGAGVSGIMFLMTLKKVREEDEKDPADLIEERKQALAEAMHAAAAEKAEAEHTPDVSDWAWGEEKEETVHTQFADVQKEDSAGQHSSGNDTKKTSGPSIKEDQSI